MFLITNTKIAVPTRDGIVDDHFGHCAYYTIFTVDSANKIIDEKTMPSPEGCGCKSNIAAELQKEGVSVMLAGSMGDGALNVLHKHDINVLRGLSGDVRQLIASYLAGNLKDSGDGCNHTHGGDHVCPHDH